MSAIIFNQIENTCAKKRLNVLYLFAFKCDILSELQILNLSNIYENIIYNIIYSYRIIKFKS